MRVLGRASVVSFLAVLVTAAWGLVALGLVLMPLMVVLAPVVEGPVEVNAGWIGVGSKMTIPVSFSVDARIHRVTAPSLSVENAQLQDVRGLLQFPVQRGAFFAGNVIFITLTFALVLWVLGNLRAVFRTLRDGRPFVRANATRIRTIAWLVIILELARSAIVFFNNYYAMTYFSADGLRFDARPDIHFTAIVDGLIILVIAEVFRAGTRLDEEQSLTV
jgi:Protein of unknown function (DUF2975)